jgi:hypothetical protein
MFEPWKQQFKKAALVAAIVFTPVTALTLEQYQPLIDCVASPSTCTGSKCVEPCALGTS